MKPVFFLQYGIAFGILLSFATSCKKTNFESPKIVIPPAKTTNYEGSSLPLDTVNVAASQWAFVDDGYYTCNVSDMARQHAGWSGYIFAAFVNIDGQDKLINSFPISYQQGELWSTKVLDVYTLYYKSPFGEMPFHSIDLKLLIAKD